MKIGRRLLFSYAVLLAFLAAVLLVSVTQLDRLAQTTQQVVEKGAARAGLASAINLNVESAAKSQCWGQKFATQLILESSVKLVVGANLFALSINYN